ncbi:MAG: cobyrinate a,c-diamide synthase [Thiotrichales bacterium]
MRIYISGAHKSSGKTTVTLGICAALVERGFVVQPFKKGPDYIDPIWLAQASSRSCFNLDFNTSHPAELLGTFAMRRGADIAIVEGNKGLHDGLALDGSDSNAAMAKLLKTPVVLVIDTRGITRSVAPLLLGYERFDPDVTVAVVILNQVGGPRHESKLRAAVEHYTDLAVVGAMHRDEACNIDERHLGLMPANEHMSAASIIGRIRERVKQQVDLERFLALAAADAASDFHLNSQASDAIDCDSGDRLRIGYARDAAFGFYYADDLNRFRQCGAELIPLDLLRDTRLPDLDGLFIGGGFPETHMGALEANHAMRASVRAAIEAGLPTYAECGGLMYLTRRIEWRGARADMVGVLPVDTIMADRPQGRGYVELEETEDAPWPDRQPGRIIKAHEFHYSTLSELPLGSKFAYRVRRGFGLQGQYDGIVYMNVLANYAHLRDQAQHHWVERFLAFVRDCRST